MSASHGTAFFTGKKYLIAGGTGFIGRRVVSFLADEGSLLDVISRRKFENHGNVHFIQEDLGDPGSIGKPAETMYDACVYMAANIPEAGQKRETYYDAKESTLDPLVNFCEAYAGHCRAFVYISSVDVLGRPPEAGYDEGTVPGNATPYGLAKFCGEFYVRAYCARNGIPWKCLRFSQVYGPHEPIVRVIPILRNALLEGREFTLYSDGQEKRRFLYVDDAVKAVCCALEKEVSGVFNIAGAEVCTMEQLARTMESVYGRQLDLKILNKAAGYDNVPSIKKAQEQLGFFPSVFLKEGLELIKREEGSNEGSDQV